MILEDLVRTMLSEELIAAKRLAEKVSTIGIDIDTKNFEDYKTTLEFCEIFGKVQDIPTAHGWHFKIRLPVGKEVSLLRSFEIRYWCGDDKHRLLRDMLKANRGCKTIDVLFDHKEVQNKSILKMLQKKRVIRH